MNNMTNNKEKSYIKNCYVLPACVIGVLFIAGLVSVGCVTFNAKDISYGIIVLLFMDLMLGAATLISLIAMYREIGRFRAREFTRETDKSSNESEKHKKELEQVKKDL